MVTISDLRRYRFFSVLCLFVVFASCGEEGSSFVIDGQDWGTQGGAGGSDSSSGLISFDELSTFTISPDATSLSETEQIPTDTGDPYYNDYIENNFTAQYTTTITFSGSTDARVEGLVSGDTVQVQGGKVVVRAHGKGLVLRVEGATDEGSLTVYSGKKFSLELHDAQITNPDGAALNLQDGNCFLVLSGSSKLSDSSGATYTKADDEDMKAVLFCEDELRISGPGSLTVSALNQQGKAAVSCDGSIFIRPNVNLQVTSGASAGNGIKAKDNLVIRGGVLNVETSAAGSKGLSSDAHMLLAGGRVTVITTGGVDASGSEPSGCAAIKCDSVLQVSGGDLRLKSTGQGGKGISGDCGVNISGGNIFILTQGSIYGSSGDSMGPGGGHGGPGGWGGGSSSSSSGNSVSPKGIRCDQDINISGGNIYIRTEGTNAEGIESKATLSISGGCTAALAYDDGFNAKTVNISGGKALAISSGSCDGVDSNGTISATGGVLIGISSTLSSEDGIDCESTLTVRDATLIGISSGGMGVSRVSGNYISTSVSGTEGDYVALCSGTTPLVTFQLPRTYKSGKLLLCTPTLASGTYQLCTGVSPTGGTLWMNYLESCTSVTGGSSTSVSCR